MPTADHNDATFLPVYTAAAQELLQAGLAGPSLKEAMQAMSEILREAVSADLVTVSFHRADGDVSLWPPPATPPQHFAWSLSAHLALSEDGWGEVQCSFERAPRDSVEQLLSVLAPQAAMLLKIALLTEQLEQRDPAQILFEHLRATDLLTEQSYRRAARLDVDLNAPHAFCAVDISPVDNRYSQVVSELREELQQSRPGSLFVEWDDDLLVCLLSIPPDASSETSLYLDLRRLAETVSASHDGAVQVYFGVGELAPTPAVSYRRSMEQALEAVQERLHLRLPPYQHNQHIIQYRDLPLLSSPFFREEANPYEGFISVLEEYDQEHGTQLLQALAIYVRPGGTTVRQGAAEMGRGTSSSTFQRHIKKTVELLATFGSPVGLNVNLSDHRTKAALHNALVHVRTE